MSTNLDELTHKLTALGFVIKDNTVHFDGFEIGECELSLFDSDGFFYGNYFPSQTVQDVLTKENIELLWEFYEMQHCLQLTKRIAGY